MSAFVLVVRLGLGCVFIMSSVPKIQQPYAFLGNVYGYELVGPKIGVLVAMVLPWMELFTGVCLVGGVFVGGALLASLGMGVLFTFVLASALYRHLDISCGCFHAQAAGKVSYVNPDPGGRDHAAQRRRLRGNDPPCPQAMATDTCRD